MSNKDQTANPALLNAIPVTASTVLAIGESAKTLAAPWLERCPRARWIAAEPKDIADEEALTALLGEARPDCLICHDLLERLDEPLTALQRLVSCLSDGATILLFFANSAHWAGLDRLLEDHWTSEDPAPCDGGRRRHYSLKSAQKVLEDCGLQAIKAQAISDPDMSARRETAIAALSSLAEALAKQDDSLQRRLGTLGYLLIAVKGAKTPPMHIHQLVMVPRFMSVRTQHPMIALNSLANVSTASSVKTLSLPQLPKGARKILIIQRQIILDAKGWTAQVKRLSSQGWVLIAEWDDHPNLLPAEVKAKWDVNPWLPMQAVHAVQTSTARLAEAFRAYNPNVAVFENALQALPPLPKKSERHLRIVFAALNREDVNAWLAPVLNTVLRDYPQTQIAIVHNQPLFEALKVEEERKSFRSSLSYPNYLSALGEAHIALLPLSGNEAEHYKSDVKFIECASRGAVCIASPLLYEGRIEDGRSGVIARSPSDWLAALRQLIEDQALRERLAAAAYDYCREERMLSSEIEERLTWYRALCKRQPDLHKELLERLAKR